MLKTLACLLLVLVSTKAFAQDELDNIPQKADKLNDFVPAHWMIDSQIEGDLNKDSKPDKVLQLIEEGPDESRGLATRVLVVLLWEQGRYRRIGLNKKLLGCGECRGNLGYGVVEIKRNILIVSVGRGSSSDGARTAFKFRYDPKEERLVLIGEDSVLNINQEYYKSSTNYLTNVSIVKKYHLDGDGLKQDSTEKSKASREWMFFEDVKYYYDDD